MVPPVFCNKHIPAKQVGTPAAFPQEFDAPLIDKAIFIKSGRLNRIGISTINKIAASDCIDQLCGPGHITPAPFTFCQHIVDLCKADYRIIRTPAERVVG